MSVWRIAGFIGLLLATAGSVDAQDRETRIRGDRGKFAADSPWLYNDLASGFAEAKQSGKPLLVVVRCIP
jgi:hypothetical protein